MALRAAIASRWKILSFAFSKLGLSAETFSSSFWKLVFRSMLRFSLTAWRARPGARGNPREKKNSENQPPAEKSAPTNGGTDGDNGISTFFCISTNPMKSFLHIGLGFPTVDTARHFGSSLAWHSMELEAVSASNGFLTRFRELFASTPNYRLRNCS